MSDDGYFLTLANVGNSTYVAKRHHFSVKNTPEHPNNGEMEELRRVHDEYTQQQ